MTTKPQTGSTNWYNTDPYKLIGHTVVKALPDGTIIEDDIVHKFNKADGKRCGSTNTATEGTYIQTEKSVVQGYVKDQDATNRFLENNDLRHQFDSVWYRPAKPYERGTIISGEDFRTWNRDNFGWNYDGIKPGQCLWVEAEDQSDDQSEAEPELTEEEKAIANTVAHLVSNGIDDIPIDELVANEIKLRARIKAAVLRARGAK